MAQHGTEYRTVSLRLAKASRPEETDDLVHRCNDEESRVASLSSSRTSTARRNLLEQTGITVGLFWMSTAFQPPAAHAAPPITAVEADNFLAKSQRLIRPKPPKALRPKLDQDFAVLLMRSSYNALDELDCVAMVRTIFVWTMDWFL